MTVWVGTAGGKRELVDPQIGTATGKKAVQEIWAGTPTGRKLVWVRQVLAVTAAPVSWEAVRLTITPPGSGVDSYVIKRNGAAVASPPAGTGGVLDPFTWDDTGLMPGTAYTYTVEAVREGTGARTATSNPATTPVRADLGLTLAVNSWSQITASWTDPSGGSIDEYRLWRGGTLVHSGPAKSKIDTGLAGSTAYTYTLRAYRGGVEIAPPDTASATTPARPTSTGSVIGPSQCGGCYQWKQSSAAAPRSTFSLPVACYVYQVDMLVSGYGSTGRINPVLSGAYKGERDLGGTGAGSPGWTAHAMGDHYHPAGGGYSLGFDHVSSGAYKTQWGYSSAGGSNSVCYRLYYWYYTATVLRDDGTEGPGRPTHTEILLGDDGEVCCVKVRDLGSGELLSVEGTEPGGCGCGQGPT